MDKDDAKHFLDKIPNRQFVPMLAYVLTMVIIAATAYALLFHEAKLPEFNRQTDQLDKQLTTTNTAVPTVVGNSSTSAPPAAAVTPSATPSTALSSKQDPLLLRWVEFILRLLPFLLGLFTLLILFAVCRRFYRRFSFSDPFFLEVLNSAHLPMVITAKKKPLKTHFANRRALAFYEASEEDVLEKGPLELDQRLKPKMSTTNWTKWEAEHKRRAEEAEVKELKSSSGEMIFEGELLGSKKWRLTTTLFSIDGEDYYLTTYSPAEENFEAPGTQNGGATPTATG